MEGYTMNSIIKADIIDIIKVNGVSLGTVGLTKANIIQMNEIVQQTGNTMLITLAVLYSLAKLIKLSVDIYWEYKNRKRL